MSKPDPARWELTTALLRRWAHRRSRILVPREDAIRTHILHIPSIFA